MAEATTTQERIDWKEVSDKLQNLLRLRTLPIGMKLFETVEEMEAVPKIRRPKKHHTTCQIVTQARQVGWTVGVTIDNLMPGTLWQTFFAKPGHPGKPTRAHVSNGA